MDASRMRQGGPGSPQGQAPVGDPKSGESREFAVLMVQGDDRVEGRIVFARGEVAARHAFLRSKVLFEIGEEIGLTFGISGGPVVRAKGRVVAVSRELEGEMGPGMDVELVGLTPEDDLAMRSLWSRAE